VFLRSRGYAVQTWGLGRNVGFRPGHASAIEQKIRYMHHESGRKVSLVGWSLGGIMARELAKQLPYDVRCVVTLGSPFTDRPRRTPTWRWTERASGHHVGPEDLFGPLREAPPVPTTSIYSRSDSVVAWHHSVEHPGPWAESIEVEASHLGLGLNPLVLWAVADRLAQPEGAWRPFARAGWQRWLYPAPP
jgi:pimeloyl-ACP methyl ester carboxylesterase